MSKKNTVIGSILGVALLGTIALVSLSNKEKAFDRLKFNFVSVNIIPWSKWTEYLTKGLRLLIKVNIVNPTNQSFWMKSIVGDAYIDNQNMGNINTNKGLFVPKNAETLLEFNAIIPTTGFSMSLLTVLKDFLFKGKTVTIRLKGYADFGTIKVPYEQIIPLEKKDPKAQ